MTPYRFAPIHRIYRNHNISSPFFNWFDEFFSALLTVVSDTSLINPRDGITQLNTDWHQCKDVIGDVTWVFCQAEVEEERDYAQAEVAKHQSQLESLMKEATQLKEQLSKPLEPQVVVKEVIKEVQVEVVKEVKVEADPPKPEEVTRISIVVVSLVKSFSSKIMSINSFCHTFRFPPLHSPSNHTPLPCIQCQCMITLSHFYFSISVYFFNFNIPFISWIKLYVVTARHFLCTFLNL